jgi:hypothetical protein
MLFSRVLFYTKINERKVKTMVYKKIQSKFWRYFQGDFLNRVNRRCRKILPTLEERIIDMFDFAG